jgi:hypothetical protein
MAFLPHFAPSGSLSSRGNAQNLSPLSCFRLSLQREGRTEYLGLRFGVGRGTARQSVGICVGEQNAALKVQR